ncbi:MAG: hypothetical protein ACRDLS_09720 [Solirubrobacteraceae bacterium]
MAWTVKLLVVANQTADSEELFETLTERAARDDIQVTLVAPASRDVGVITGASATRQRVGRAVNRLREAGVSITGVVGAADPLVAVSEAWDPWRFDEVIVVTFPTGTSRWLTFDLPRRIERLTGAQVTHIVAGAPVRSMAPAN